MDVVNFAVGTIGLLLVVGMARLFGPFFRAGYSWIWRTSVYVGRPIRGAFRWTVNKIPVLNRFMNWYDTSCLVNTLEVFGTVVLFLASLIYFVACLIVSRHWLNFLLMDFLATLPSLSILGLIEHLISGEPGLIPQLMAETTMISLILYHINNKVEKAGAFVKILYNLAFTFIGWGISQVVVVKTLAPLVAQLPNIFGIFQGDFWAILFGIPILGIGVRLATWAVSAALLVMAAWVLLLILVVALREFVAPLFCSLVLLAVLVIIGAMLPSNATVIYAVICFAGFIVCAIYRVMCLRKIEDLAEAKAEENLERIRQLIINRGTKREPDSRQDSCPPDGF